MPPKYKHFGGDFCCVPMCSNQRGKDKFLGVTRSYYKLPKVSSMNYKFFPPPRNPDKLPLLFKEYFTSNSSIYTYKTRGTDKVHLNSVHSMVNDL